MEGWCEGVSFRVFSGCNQKEGASFLLLWDHAHAEHENPAEAVGYQSIVTPR